MPPPIVILTGAGISRESGLATFRDADGIWARHRIEDVATPEAFARDPDLVQGFYNARRAQLLDPTIQPNAAHLALARLEAAWPAPVTLVTQNIDGLHRRAGSRNVIAMHGELLKARCLACGGVSAWAQDITAQATCPACGATGRLRPHIVWFGEIPLEMDRIEAALDDCGMFVSIGTSGQVYPAAGFVRSVRGHARVVELNLEETEGTALFHEAHHGPATEIVPALVERLLASCG
ncbi:MAG: NAD-dependent protein deacylase [Roseomonas sp.]|nr:NAD-dependent protein deacylase [Roseomonas sp.]MCA3304211.1 NAD-dependent protein deacylase [Roseomonas sp.]